MEITGLQQKGFAITVTDNLKPEVNTCKEIYLISDTMFIPFAVSQDIMHNTIM